MIKTIKKYKPIILVELNKENFGKIIDQKNITNHIYLYMKKIILT